MVKSFVTSKLQSYVWIGLEKEGIKKHGRSFVSLVSAGRGWSKSNALFIALEYVSTS